MATTMVKHFTGVNTMVPTSNSLDVTLPSAVVVGNSFILLQSRNIGDSTYGGSAGNCLFTAKFLNTTTVRIERVRSWDQQMSIDWEVVELTIPVPSVEVTLTSGVDCNTGLIDNSTVPFDGNIPFYDIRGNNWASSMKEWLVSVNVINKEVVIRHNCPTGTILKLFMPKLFPNNMCAIPRDDSNNNVSDSISVFGYGSPITEKQLWGWFTVRPASTAPNAEPNHIKSGYFEVIGTDGYFKASSYQPFSFQASSVFFLFLKEIALHGVEVFTGAQTTKTVALQSAVKINGNMSIINSPFFSWASVDTYSEEFGDMTFTSRLNDRGDGLADTVTISRGTSGSGVPATVSWSVLNVNDESVIPVTFVFDYYYRQRRMA